MATETPIETIASKQAREKSRKAYASPELVDYGSIAQLTLGGLPVGNEGNTQCVGQSGREGICS